MRFRIARAEGKKTSKERRPLLTRGSRQNGLYQNLHTKVRVDQRTAFKLLYSLLINSARAAQSWASLAGTSRLSGDTFFGSVINSSSSAAPVMVVIAKHYAAAWGLSNCI